MKPTATGFSLLLGGRLVPVPRNLLNFGAITPEALEGADFLSREGRRRAAGEAEIRAKTGDEDESIASFFRRRFGDEFSQVVVEPLLAGTHSGRPEELSMQALFPRYVRMEREFGSLGGGTDGSGKCGFCLVWGRPSGAYGSLGFRAGEDEGFLGQDGAGGPLRAWVSGGRPSL